MEKKAYEILHAGKRDNLSVIFPTASLRGIAVASNTVAGDEQITAKLCGPSDPELLGHLARNITTDGGPPLEDQVFGQRLEAPDKAGKETTVEDVEIYSVEGSDRLHATNPLAAKDDKVTFEDGKARIAQAGEYFHYVVLAKIDAFMEDNTDRFVLKRVQSGQVPAAE